MDTETSKHPDLSEETALCFGRIDRVDGDLYYIGRRHVHGERPVAHAGRPSGAHGASHTLHLC